MSERAAGGGWRRKLGHDEGGLRTSDEAGSVTVPLCGSYALVVVPDVVVVTHTHRQPATHCSEEIRDDEAKQEERAKTIYRSSKTGRMVTRRHAEAHPSTTRREGRPPARPTKTRCRRER